MSYLNWNRVKERNTLLWFVSTLERTSLWRGFRLERKGKTHQLGCFLTSFPQQTSCILSIGSDKFWRAQAGVFGTTDCNADIVKANQPPLIGILVDTMLGESWVHHEEGNSGFGIRAEQLTIPDTVKAERQWCNRLAASACLTHAGGAFAIYKTLSCYHISRSDIFLHIGMTIDQTMDGNSTQ